MPDRKRSCNIYLFIYFAKILRAKCYFVLAVTLIFLTVNECEPLPHIIHELNFIYLDMNTDLYMNIHGSVIQSRQKLETIYISINGDWIDS